MRWAVVAAAVLAVVAAGALLYHVYAPRATAPPQPPLARLEGAGLEPFADLFERDRHLTRVVLMLSPT